MRDMRWLSLARKIAGWKDYKGTCAVLTVGDKLVAIYQQPTAINRRLRREGTIYLWGFPDLLHLTTVDRVVVEEGSDYAITGAYVDEVNLS